MSKVCLVQINSNFLGVFFLLANAEEKTIISGKPRKISNFPLVPEDYPGAPLPFSIATFHCSLHRRVSKSAKQTWPLLKLQRVFEQNAA